VARQIVIPGIARLLIADRPGDVIALSRHPKLLRGGTAVGPLLNRYVLGNIARALRYREWRLPSALPADDAARAARQQELALILDPARMNWSVLPIKELAAYVKGDLRLPLGPLCQQAAGRAFDPEYRATRETWAAAKTLDRAVRSLNPLTQLSLAVTGRLRRAQRRLFEAAGGDTFCMHATGIAVHTLVDAVERLRLALADEGTRRHAMLGQIFGQALLGPDSVARHTRGFVDDVPGVEVKPGTLVLLRPKKASQFAVDPRITFMSKTWSACPADRLVQALIARIWEEATGEVMPPLTRRATAKGATW